MEITFEKVNNEYIAEFEITTDSNLHIEKKCAASTKLYQRTNGGGWDLVDETKNMQGAVDDFDLSALVYPKFVKVVCNAEPLYAEVTTSGEVTEIKSQSKEIEVTSNGTTEVTPDAGFAYLNSVKVKTNVQSGGASGENTYEYIDVRGVNNIEQLGQFGITVKLESGKGIQVLPVVGSPIASALAISFDTSIEYITPNGKMKCSDILTQLGADSLPRITEEEFYNLNA